MAAQKRHTEIVKYLIESKANVNEDNEIISTLLLVAAQKRHTEIANI